MPAADESPSAIPDFSLPASTGQTLGLGSFKGKVPLVLVFLDLDTDRALLQALNAGHREFGSERSQVLAVARVTAREARVVAEETDLSVPILADASGAMAREYDVERGVGRVAVVADREGLLVRRFDPLPVDDDPSEVVAALLDAVRAIGREPGD